MRVASFLFLSLALHAAALAYPVSFSAQKHMQIMRVTLLSLDQETMIAGAPGAKINSRNGNPAPRIRSKSPAGRPVGAPRDDIDAKPAKDAAPEAVGAEIPTDLNDSALASAILGAATEGPLIADSNSNGTESYGPEARAAGGSDTVSKSAGAGAGSGRGGGSSSAATHTSQARYRDTPRPDYPESARREGREGRVLLRVLVDSQGRSKQVEINSSSGSDVLDRAAAETIRRWLFYPAQHGDRPVESWLRIPIEFRLADAKSW